MTVPNLSFGGLAAPFDVNALIDQVMAAEAIPLQNLQETRQGYLDKDSAWSGIVTRMSALRSAVDGLDLNAFGSATSSNEAAATVSVTGKPTPSTITFDIKALATTHTVHSDSTTATADELLNAGTVTVTVDGTDHDIVLDGTQTITDLANSITGLGVGVVGNVVETGTDEYTLVMTAATTGADAAFTVSSTVTGFTSFSTAVTGADSRIEVGSLVVEQATNTISDLLPGVTIELHAVVDDVTVTATRDFEGSGAGAADLVARLNDVLGELARLTDYNATSQTAGVLAGDSTARSLATSLRAAVSGAVGAEPTTYVGAAIGISLNRTGTFEFDQEEFEQALANDFDGVVAFIEDVVLDNLDTELDAAEGINGSIARARDRWKNQIDFIDDRIADFEDRLDRKEAALIRQFSALETALQSLYTQQAWLTNQISALNGGL